jgi:hypothetical protein
MVVGARLADMTFRFHGIRLEFFYYPNTFVNNLLLLDRISASTVCQQLDL